MKTYKSKIGIEFIIFFFTLFGGIGYSVFKEGFSFLKLLIFIIPIILIVYIFLSVKYIVIETKLNISCGFLFNKNIDIKSIRKISETNNPIGSVSTSINRLEIGYNKYDSIVVSPKFKKEFVNSLLSINPNIEVFYNKK